jgi:hypothetical protein
MRTMQRRDDHIAPIFTPKTYGHLSMPVSILRMRLRQPQRLAIRPSCPASANSRIFSVTERPAPFP